MKSGEPALDICLVPSFQRNERPPPSPQNKTTNKQTSERTNTRTTKQTQTHKLANDRHRVLTQWLKGRVVQSAPEGSPTHSLAAQESSGFPGAQTKQYSRITDHRVLGGTLKSMNIDKIHKMLPKFGSVIFEKTKSCGRIIDHTQGAWRDP